MVMSTKKIVRGIDKSLNKAVSEINASTPKPDMKDDGAELKAAVAPKNDLSFAEAFKANRMAGNKTFTWKGKSYHTRTAEEESRTRRAAAPKAGASTPKAGASTPKAGATTPKAGATTPKAGATTPKAGATTPKAGATTPKAGATTPKPAVRTGIAQASRTAPAAKPTPKIPAAPVRQQKPDWAKGLRSASPALLQRKEEPKPKPGSLLMRKKEEKPKPGSLLMKKAKGGKIDGAAIRGKTRAMKKGK